MGPGTKLTFSGVDFTNVSGVEIPPHVLIILQRLPASPYNKIEWEDYDPLSGDMSFWVARAEKVNLLMALRVEDYGGPTALSVLEILGTGGVRVRNALVEFLRHIAKFYMCDDILVNASRPAMQKIMLGLGAKEEYRVYSLEA